MIQIDDNQLFHRELFDFMLRRLGGSPEVMSEFYRYKVHELVVRGGSMGQLLDNAQGVVFPSIGYENQPLAILEAFARGKPVIASNLGGMTELVKDGERGLLVPPGDVSALADAMRWLAQHPGAARAMGQRARECVLREHSPEGHYRGLMAVYERVTHTRP